MKKFIHYSDDIRGFYLNTVELDVPDNFKLPNNATLEPVPTVQDGKKARLTSNKTWEIVDDPDLKTVYDENGDKKLISIYETGNYSDSPKPSEDAILENGKWITDSELRETIFRKKYQEISVNVDSAITGGFRSSITGTDYIYDSDLRDQFEIDILERSGGNWEIKCTGEDGIKRRVMHTEAQIKNLKADFFGNVLHKKIAGDSKKELLSDTYKSLPINDLQNFDTSIG